MLRFVSDHLNTEKMWKHAVKKSPFVINYVPDRYETQKICDKVILKNDKILMFIPDCYKDQEMCDNAVDNNVHALGFVPDKVHKICHKAVSTYTFSMQLVSDQCRTQEMCDKAVNTCQVVHDFVPDRYVIQELSGKLVSKEPFMFKYSMTNINLKKCVIELLVLKCYLTVSINNNDIVFGDLGSKFVTFFRNYPINNPINFDHDNLMIVIQKLLVMLDLWLGIIDLNNKACKEMTNGELLPVAWHLTRAWDFCILQDKKKVKLFLIDEKYIRQQLPIASICS